MHISEQVLDKTLLSKLKTYNLEVMNDNDLEHHLNEKIIIVTDDNKLLSVAFISDINEKELSSYLQEELKWLYDAEEDFEFLRMIVSKIKDGINLKGIESIEKGKAAGTWIVNYLKDKYLSIFLYAMREAEDYWIKHGFSEIGDYYYVWSKKYIKFDKWPLAHSLL